MLSRRLVVAGLAGSALGLHATTANAQAILTDDGIYTQPWFLQSFLDLPEDLQGAIEKRKRLAIMWELKGCPFCRDTHLKNFSQPAIENYIKDRFEILQLNILGSREVTDFDGQKLTEKAFASKYGVRYTPTFQFFPETVEGLGAKKPRDREVARGQGYIEPKRFVAMFRYVVERGYENGGLDDYLKSNALTGPVSRP